MDIFFAVDSPSGEFFRILSYFISTRCCQQLGNYSVNLWLWRRYRLAYFLLMIEQIICLQFGSAPCGQRGGVLSVIREEKKLRKLQREIMEGREPSCSGPGVSSRELSFFWFPFISFRQFILKIRKGNLSPSSEEKNIRYLILCCSMAWQDPPMRPRRNFRRLWIRSSVIANVMSHLSIIEAY